MNKKLLARMERRAQFLCILDTMWGQDGAAIPWFPISQFNHSGKRLYRITQTVFPAVWVTNVCPQQTDHATKHGKPDCEWLLANLDALKFSEALQSLPLLVMGTVAQKHFDKLEYNYDFAKQRLFTGPIIRLPHPAWRAWTKKLIQETQEEIENVTRPYRNKENLRDSNATDKY
jgi:hypothetical protein